MSRDIHAPSKPLNKTFKQLLQEMEKINNSEVARKAKLRRVNVFVFPRDEEGREIDINGSTPFSDLNTYNQVRELLLKFYNGDIARVKAMLNTPYKKILPGTSGLSDCFICEYKYSVPGSYEVKTATFRFKFWTYGD